MGLNTNTRGPVMIGLLVVILATLGGGIAGVVTHSDDTKTSTAQTTSTTTISTPVAPSTGAPPTTGTAPSTGTAPTLPTAASTSSTSAAPTSATTGGGANGVGGTAAMQKPLAHSGVASGRALALGFPLLALGLAARRGSAASRPH